MKIGELMNRCLGGHYNTVSIERPIGPHFQTEILFNGKFSVGLVPKEIAEMEFEVFSINGEMLNLKTDIVIYVR